MTALQSLLTQIRAIFQSPPKSIEQETPQPEPKTFPDSAFIGEVDRKHWPTFMNCDEVKGVFVGACYYAQGKKWKRSFGSAHAHTNTGWICFQSMKKFGSRLICLHETSHILSKSGHKKCWAERYIQLANGRPKWLTIEWLASKYKFKT